MKGKIFLCLLLSFLGILACKKDKTLAPVIGDLDCTEEISFALDVKPIIDMNCSTAGCHNASAAGGFNFSTFSAIEANADRIFNVISHNAAFTPMPMSADKLPDSLIQKIGCWINQGKLDN